MIYHNDLYMGLCYLPQASAGRMCTTDYLVVHIRSEQNEPHV